MPEASRKPLGAPTLGRDWRKELEALMPGWDNYGAPEIGDAKEILDKHFAEPSGNPRREA